MGDKAEVGSWEASTVSYNMPQGKELRCFWTDVTGIQQKTYCISRAHAEWEFGDVWCSTMSPKKTGKNLKKASPKADSDSERTNRGGGVHERTSTEHLHTLTATGHWFSDNTGEKQASSTNCTEALNARTARAKCAKATTPQRWFRLQRTCCGFSLHHSAIFRLENLPF